MATALFGDAFPDWFGDLGKSLFTLFQVMTLESWSMGIARPVMDVYPYAFLFFMPFVLISAFVILNFFVAIIVIICVVIIFVIVDIFVANKDIIIVVIIYIVVAIPRV